MTSIVMRVLSLFPMIVAIICGILLLASLIGIDAPEQSEQVPLIPCGVPGFQSCPVGMTSDNLTIPPGFVLLDIDATIEWERPDVAWVGLVDASAADTCPPDDNGLTECEASEFDFLAGGNGTDGSFEYSFAPGDTRFVTGGNPGSADLASQKVTINIECSFSWWVETLLFLAGAGLLGSAFDMNFPLVSRLFARFGKKA